eukprot:1179988-Prorocentrum_minimum.AAC.3
MVYHVFMLSPTASAKDPAFFPPRGGRQGGGGRGVAGGWQGGGLLDFLVALRPRPRHLLQDVRGAEVVVPDALAQLVARVHREHKQPGIHRQQPAQAHLR